LVEREEEIAAQETQEKAATKAAIKREVDLVPQHSSDDESHDDNSSESDKEIEEIKPKMKKAKREVEEGKEEEDMPVAKKKGGGYNKEQAWSEEMTAFLGRGYMSRPQVTKHVWDYIKEKDLQNPADRRVILCDPVLKSLFGGVEKINMFKMPKAINKHVRHDDREKEEDEDDEDDGENEFDSDDEGDSRKRKASSAAKAKTEKNKKKAAAAATSVRTKTNVKKEDRNGAPAKQGGGRGFPQEKISKELQALIGKETASRNEVVKKLWEHIKANDMQDPSVGFWSVLYYNCLCYYYIMIVVNYTRYVDLWHRFWGRWRLFLFDACHVCVMRRAKGLWEYSGRSQSHARSILRCFLGLNRCGNKMVLRAYIMYLELYMYVAFVFPFFKLVSNAS